MKFGKICIWLANLEKNLLLWRPKKEQLQKPNKKNASINKNDSTSLGNFHSVSVEEHTFQGDDFKVIKEDILNVLLMRITDDISCLPKFQGKVSKDNIKTMSDSIKIISNNIKRISDNIKNKLKNYFQWKKVLVMV